MARICRDEIGRHTALNYYMSALLLDKKLDKFVSAVDMYCFEQDTLPRYYREALVLYKRTHPGYGREVKDTLMVRRLDEFLNRQKEFSSPVEEKNHMRREYGDTYLVVLSLSISYFYTFLILYFAKSLVLSHAFFY